MKVSVSPLLVGLKSEITYFFKLLGINKGMSFEVSFSENQVCDLGLEGMDAPIKVSHRFLEGKLSNDLLNTEGLLELNNGEPDFISTAFFCITAYQEFSDKSPDAFGRFQYKNSYQAKLNNSGQNIVQRCFDQIAKTLKVNSFIRKSSFFLSHDIDTVYGSIKEDGFNVLKQGRIDKFLGLLFNAVIGKPDWLNIDQILKIENDYDCRSVFYWIVNHGAVNGHPNADYKFQSQKIKGFFETVHVSKSENGIHKSLSNETFREEIGKFGTQPLGNRYHYLKFGLPEGFDAIEAAGIKLDASLGFSEQWGFRNNYGLPFNPYDFKNKRPYSFVEVPLHIMDRTFFNKRMDLKQVEKEIFDFFEMHRENCVISVLWHNNFFSDYKYKGYLTLYKKILAYIHENNFNTISQKEIIENYTMLWP